MISGQEDWKLYQALQTAKGLFLICLPLSGLILTQLSKRIPFPSALDTASPKVAMRVGNLHRFYSAKSIAWMMLFAVIVSVALSVPALPILWQRCQSWCILSFIVVTSLPWLVWLIDRFERRQSAEIMSCEVELEVVRGSLRRKSQGAESLIFLLILWMIGLALSSLCLKVVIPPKTPDGMVLYRTK